MSETTKRYIKSSIVTFLSAFSLYFVMVIDDITLASFYDGALVSLVFTGIRAGVKALLESFILAQQTINNDEA